MALNSLINNPAYLRIVLILIGLGLFLAAVLLRRFRLMRLAQSAGAESRAVESRKPALAAPRAQQAEAAKKEPPALHLRFETIADRPSILMDLLRAALVLLCFVTVLAWILIIIPQGAIDRIALRLLPRNMPVAPQEKVALLFLGDEVKDKEFTIRGVVRNISSEPLENLDAVIRLYGPDGSVLDTAIVRMDFEIIASGVTAQFHLTYHDYNQQFGSYVIDFKSRQGELVPYTDMRTARARS